MSIPGICLPIVVDDKIESVTKTKDLINILNALGIEADLEKSHKPKSKSSLRSKERRRKFRNSAVIITKNAEKIEKRLEEMMNTKEYILTLKSAIGGFSGCSCSLACAISLNRPLFLEH